MRTGTACNRVRKVETIHVALKVKRDEEQNYEPPGRLRDFDLIVFDECSQIDSESLLVISSTCNTYAGNGVLEERMRNQVRGGKMKHVELRQHDQARTQDPELLKLLHSCRLDPPNRDVLETFFAGLCIRNV